MASKRDRFRPMAITALVGLGCLLSSAALLPASAEHGYVARFALPLPGVLRTAATARTDLAPANLRGAAALPSYKTQAGDAQVPPGVELEITDVDRLPLVARAAREAISTSIAQPWQGYGLRGYAVAGPAEVVGRLVCRRLAIWAVSESLRDSALSDTSGGRSTGSTWCVNEKGEWQSITIAYRAGTFGGSEHDPPLASGDATRSHPDMASTSVQPTIVLTARGATDLGEAVPPTP